MGCKELDMTEQLTHTHTQKGGIEGRRGRLRREVIYV